MIKLLGELHRTRDGRQFAIDSVQIIPATGAYDVVLFGVRGADSEFSMGVAFPHESASAWGANDSLVREGLGWGWWLAGVGGWGWVGLGWVGLVGGVVVGLVETLTKFGI